MCRLWRGDDLAIERIDKMKQAKKEAEEQAKREKEEQQAQKEIEDEWGELAYDYGDGDVSVFCDRGQHYTKAKNIVISEDGRNVCEDVW